MPSLASLALRYLLWLIGLRVLYIAAVNFLGIPNALATTVILTSVPAMDIGIQTLRRAKGPLDFRAWATIWGVMVSIHLILNVVVPAMLVPGFRAVMADAVGLRALGMVSAATLAMLALFLWIGARMGRAEGSRGG